MIFYRFFYILKVGCVNSMKATFELIKNDAPNQNINQKQQFLSVIVPEEFKDNFYIRVEIVKSKNFRNFFLFLQTF